MCRKYIKCIKCDLVRNGGENMETNYFMDIEGFEEYWGYEPVYDESEE